MSKDCLVFLIYLRDDSFEVPSIESALIVCELVDIFPTNLFGMPPDRDINFCIDLEPDTSLFLFHLIDCPLLS